MTASRRVRFVIMKPFVGQVESVVEQLRAAADIDLDGIIEYAHCWRIAKSRSRYRPVLSSVIAVMGRRTAEILARWGNPRETIEIVGSPRFDSYAHTAATNPPPQSILLTCANTPFWDHESERNFAEGFSDVAAALRERGVDYTVRLPAAAQRALVDSSFENATCTDASTRRGLADDIRSAGAVITTMSTVALESMALGRPTAVLNYPNESSYLHTPWTITHKDQIDCVIDELLAPPPPKLEMQDLELREHLVNDGQATARVVALVRRMLGEAGS